MARDTIRIRYQKVEVSGNRRLLHNEVVYHDYQVAVDNDELVLTPAGDDAPKVGLRYRRYFP